MDNRTMVSSGWNGRTSRKALRGSIATLTSNPHPFSMCFLRLRAHQTHIKLNAKLLIRVKVVASGMNLQGCSLTSRSKSISFLFTKAVSILCCSSYKEDRFYGSSRGGVLKDMCAALVGKPWPYTPRKNERFLNLNLTMLVIKKHA